MVIRSLNQKLSSIKSSSKSPPNNLNNNKDHLNSNKGNRNNRKDNPNNRKDSPNNNKDVNNSKDNLLNKDNLKCPFLLINSPSKQAEVKNMYCHLKKRKPSELSTSKNKDYLYLHHNHHNNHKKDIN